MDTRLVACAITAAVATSAAADDWDEFIHGDLSNDESNPTFLSLDLGSNVVTGTVGGEPLDEFHDAFTFTISPGQTLDAIRLIYFIRADGNLDTGFNVISGPNWDGDFDSPNFIATARLRPAYAGTDLLDQRGLDGSLGPGDYTIAIREYTPGQQYSFDLVVIPSPASATLLGLGAVFAVRRRR